MKVLTDKERVEIAKLEYQQLELNRDAITEGGLNIGKVKEVIKNDYTGLFTYVIESNNQKEIFVLYRGSAAPGKKGAFVDWCLNDIPAALQILGLPEPISSVGLSATPQMWQAATVLNKILKNYPNAKISIYGHSLGSMNAQYALANVDDIDRIQGAYLYQGPNIYHTLNKAAQQKVDRMKYRIHNYIDERDPIAFGYIFESLIGGAVGTVHHVDSNADDVGISQRHSWGGYIYNEDG